MSVAHLAPTRRTAPARRRGLVRGRATRPHPPHRPAFGAPTLADTVSAQRCGTPQDQALYRCECGRDFRAAVSAGVGCPGCGTTQDW